MDVVPLQKEVLISVYLFELLVTAVKILVDLHFFFIFNQPS
jgi:hypothetical protein